MFTVSCVLVQLLSINAAVAAVNSNFFIIDGSFSEGMLSPSVFLIFNRFTGPKPSEDLPAARYFGTPAGLTLYKKDDTLLIMKIGEYFSTAHDHYDCGHFEIYHRGILASDSGYYDWFGCEHHYNYLNRTYAHNCVTVSDPAKIGTTVPFWFTACGQVGSSVNLYPVGGKIVAGCQKLSLAVRGKGYDFLFIL